jgi:hypothetical protein
MKSGSDRTSRSRAGILPHRNEPARVDVSPSALRPATLVLATCACLVATVGVAAIWAGASAITRGQCAWMAVVAALDAVVLLRLASWPPGRARASMAIATTLSTVAVANYFVAATLIGLPMGMRPFESVPRMSMELAMMYASSNNGWIELGWTALACVAAWRLGR